MTLWSFGLRRRSLRISACTWRSCSSRGHTCEKHTQRARRRTGKVRSRQTVRGGGGSRSRSIPHHRRSWNPSVSDSIARHEALVDAGVRVLLLLADGVHGDRPRLERRAQHLLQRRRHRGAEAERLALPGKGLDDALDGGAEPLVEELVAFVLRIWTRIRTDGHGRTGSVRRGAGDVCTGTGAAAAAAASTAVRARRPRFCSRPASQGRPPPRRRVQWGGVGLSAHQDEGLHRPEALDEPGSVGQVVLEPARGGHHDVQLRTRNDLRTRSRTPTRLTNKQLRRVRREKGSRVARRDKLRRRAPSPGAGACPSTCSPRRRSSRP